jgi:hypothetical protein
MIDQRLFMYIEQELRRGVPNAAIKNALREASWAEDAIGQAFAAVQNRNAPPRPEQEFVEDPVRPGTDKPKKIRTKGGRLPVVATVGIVGVIVAVLAAAWYFIFIVPEQPAEISENTPNILKKDNSAGGVADSNQAAQSDSASVVPGSSGNGTTGDAAAASSDQPTQAVPVTNPPPATGGDANAGGAPAAGQADVATVNDAKRKEDINKLAAAQALWFGEHKAYYTCGLSSGDCGGKPYGYPEQIGVYLSNAGQDPLVANYAGKKAACGTDYVYCGLNNSSYSQFFCYYAKLESGGYYTVSQAGSAVRSSVPKVFEQCGVAE